MIRPQLALSGAPRSPIPFPTRFARARRAQVANCAPRRSRHLPLDALRATGSQRPAPSAQRPAPSAQRPAPSAQRPLFTPLPPLFTHVRAPSAAATSAAPVPPLSPTISATTATPSGAAKPHHMALNRQQSMPSTPSAAGAPEWLSFTRSLMFHGHGTVTEENIAACVMLQVRRASGQSCEGEGRAMLQCPTRMAAKNDNALRAAQNGSKRATSGPKRAIFGSNAP